jgi:hypothetical protein
MKRLAMLAVVTLFGCANTSSPTMAPEHRYVVMGPDGTAVARAITSAAECPELDADGIPRAMQVRMPAGTIPLRPTRSDPSMSKPSAFPVLTCEATIPAGTVRAAIAGLPLPLPKAHPQRIVIIGDTGCRIKTSDNVFQNCDDPTLWPFERIANAAAATAPDLVIHVGDYHYRENACPAGDPGCAGSPWGYGWDAWRADLFHPGRRLLEVAPWILLRGNHESCNRAGQGWWRFLDPRPVAPLQDCNAAVNDSIGDYSEPYAVPLGADPGTQFIVFDSSLAGVTPLKPDDPMYRNYHAQFERVFAQTARAERTFFMAHHPVLGFASNPSNPQSPFPGNGGLQSVLQASYASALFPANVEVLVSGHNHLLEIVNFASMHPPQIISGNAGDWADEAFPVPFPKDRQPAPGAVVDELITTTRFGFMTLDRDGTAWQLRAWDVDGALQTACMLAQRQIRCTPIAAR